MAKICPLRNSVRDFCLGVVGLGKHKTLDMEYKVIPFIAHIDHKTGSSNHVSIQLEQIINKYSEQGWTYVRMETVSNNVASDAGCFGLGAKPGFTLVSHMIVFKK